MWTLYFEFPGLCLRVRKRIHCHLRYGYGRNWVLGSYSVQKLGRGSTVDDPKGGRFHRESRRGRTPSRPATASRHTHQSEASAGYPTLGPYNPHDGISTIRSRTAQLER